MLKGLNESKGHSVLYFAIVVARKGGFGNKRNIIYSGMLVKNVSFHLSHSHVQEFNIGIIIQKKDKQLYCIIKCKFD